MTLFFDNFSFDRQTAGRMLRLPFSTALGLSYVANIISNTKRAHALQGHLQDIDGWEDCNIK